MLKCLLYEKFIFIFIKILLKTNFDRKLSSLILSRLAIASLSTNQLEKRSDLIFIQKISSFKNIIVLKEITLSILKEKIISILKETIILIINDSTHVSIIIDDLKHVLIIIDNSKHAFIIDKSKHALVFEKFESIIISDNFQNIIISKKFAAIILMLKNSSDIDLTLGKFAAISLIQIALNRIDIIKTRVIQIDFERINIIKARIIHVRCDIE